MSSSRGRKYDPTEEFGIQKVKRIITGFGWILRDVRTPDFGVDLDIEHVDNDREPTGRHIYVQVKSGPSYFLKGSATHVFLYTDAEHIKYWGNHTSPVAVVLHDETAGITIWEWISAAVEIGRTWRINVPRTQFLDDSAKSLWADKATENATIDPWALDQLGHEVRQNLEEPSASNKATAYLAQDDSIGPLPQLAQLQLGSGELPEAALAQIGRLFDEKLRGFRSPALESGPDYSQDPRRAGEDQTLHAKIDQLRQIKNDGNPSVAHGMLGVLIPQIEPSRDPYAYFRARTNRAACALEIGLEQEAIDEFVSVWEIEKTNPHALANLALARLIERNYQGAYDAAVEALAGAGAPPHVLGALFGAAARLEIDEPPLNLIPEKLRQTDEAELALIEFMRVRDDPEWTEKVLEAYERHPGDRTFQRLWIYAVLEKATTDRRTLPGGLTTVSMDTIRDAAEALRSIVEGRIAVGYHDREDLANEATNAAVAFRLIDEYQPGIALLKRVLEKYGNQPNAARMLGVLEAMNGDEQDALRTFELVPDDGEAQLLKAEILGQEDPADALVHVLAIPEEDIPDHHRDSRWIIAAKLAIEVGDIEKAQDAIAKLREIRRSSIFADVFEARLQEREGVSKSDLSQMLLRAASAINKETHFPARMALAEALERYDSPLAASRVLDGTIDTSRDTLPTRIYIRLLATSGRDQDFYVAFAALPDSSRDDTELVWLKAVHAFNHGDLAESERQANKLSRLRPKDLQPVLIKLQTLIRRGKVAKVRSILDTPVEVLEASSLSDRVQIGQILVKYGYDQRGLDLLYRLLLENRDDPKLWVNFGSAVLMSGRQEEQTFIATSVGNNVSITLKFAESDRPGTSLNVVVEPNADLRKLDPDAREPDHPDLKAIWGLSEGDKFILADGRAGTITELRHKFVARMQTVLQQFEDRFPAADGFKGIQVDVEKEGGLDEVKAILKERSDFVEQEAQSYESGSSPLSIFAYRIGVSTIDAASGLAQTGRKFQVALGETRERQAATVALVQNAGRGAVVDAQTFDTIWKIDALEAVVAVVGKLHFSASTLDVLNTRLQLLETSLTDKDGHSSLSYQEGDLSLSRVSQEEVKRQREEQIRANAWLEENGELSAVNLPDDLPDDMREVMAGFKVPILDEILIAKEKDLLLLVDDLRIRLWARGFVARSAWLHWILGFATDSGKASQSDYACWSAKLIAGGQTYLGLAPHVFVEALREDAIAGASKPTAVFITLCQCLGGVHADMPTHIRIACQILESIWNDGDFRDIRQNATSAILGALTSRRNEDYQLILGIVVRAFNRRGQIADYIEGWLRGHFLSIS